MKIIVNILVLFSSLLLSQVCLAEKSVSLITEFEFIEDAEVSRLVGVMNQTYADLNLKVINKTATKEEVLDELHLLSDLLTGDDIGGAELELLECHRTACSGE